ncbi:hypothetical protein [Streptomyces sp. NPDC048720]|uniref:portal protein n=1 Tax=Streptomyces sp. NPDC048720 TaxID=3365588 RepID=UPI00371E2C0A
MAKSSSVVPTADASQFSEEQVSELASRTKQKDFENQVINWTKSAHLRCRTVRQQLERQWYLNLAFYSGKQNVQLVPTSGSSGSSIGVRLYVPPAPYYRSRPVINRIRPIIRTELSKLTAQKPSATVVPSTSDDSDLAAAQAGEQIWNSIYREKKIHSVFRQSMLWTLCCGTGFMKVYWDGTKKSSQWENWTQEQMIAVQSMGGPAQKPPDGDFCFENITPFHLFVPDLMQEDIENQPYVIQVQTRSAEWVKLHYGLDMPPNVMEASDILNDSFLNLVGAGEFRKDSIMCYEVWIKPGNVTFMPEGGMFTIVGDRLVQFVKGNPYSHQQYPFAKIAHIPTGRFYGDSVITDLIPIQREYNRTRGQITENKNKMAHLQLVAAKGAITASKINTEPGQVIEYNLGFPPPEPMPLQTLPAYVLQEIDRLLMDFEDISGQHQVSKGQVPSGVTAATAINYLQEQDESMLSVTHDGIEEAFGKLGYQTLCHVQQYWDLPRKVKVTGKDGYFNVISFQGADLKGNTDVQVEAGSSLPTSKAAKQAFLMDMMTQGFIPPEKGLELMEMGGVQRLYEEIQVDAAQASRENMRMSAVTQEQMSEYSMTFVPKDPMTGQPDPSQGLIDPNTSQPLMDQAGNPTAPPLIVPVNSFDAHQVHIQIHNTYRKSQEFEQLTPEIKQLFEEHVNQHMMAMGMIPGQPAPQQGQNAVTSGGMEQGQADQLLQQIAGSPQDASADQSQMDPNSQGGQQTPPPQMGGEG